MSWEFKIDLDLAERNLNTVGTEMRQAGVRSLNLTASEIAKHASELISTRYNVLQAKAAERISVKKATETNLEAVILASSKPSSLASYQPEQDVRGVSVSIIRGTRKVVRPRTGTFKTFLAAPIKSLVQGVFVRTSKKRYPVRFLYGPSILMLFRARKISEPLGEFAAIKIEEHVTEQFKD